MYKSEAEQLLEVAQYRKKIEKLEIIVSEHNNEYNDLKSIMERKERDYIKETHELRKIRDAKLSELEKPRNILRERLEDLLRDEWCEIVPDPRYQEAILSQQSEIDALKSLLLIETELRKSKEEHGGKD